MCRRLIVLLTACVALTACEQDPIRDDIGLLAVGVDAAEGLYRLVDAAYEKRSIALSNLHPAGFDELMPKTLATATVDRLLHHAHICQTSGDSVRLTQAMAGKGVNTLT
jgi:DNA replication protein DnaC